MQTHKFLIKTSILVLSMLTFPCFSKDTVEPSSKTGTVFGGYGLCCSYVWQDYQLRVRKVGDKKTIPLTIVTNRKYVGQFKFIQRLPPGKYYFYKFSAAAADWSKEIYTKEKAFEVTEGKVTYLGDWNFKIRPNSISFSVLYDEKSVSSFFEENPEYSNSNLLIGVHGKASLSPAQIQAPSTNGIPNN